MRGTLSRNRIDKLIRVQKIARQQDEEAVSYFWHPCYNYACLRWLYKKDAYDEDWEWRTRTGDRNGCNTSEKISGTDVTLPRNLQGSVLVRCTMQLKIRFQRGIMGTEDTLRSKITMQHIYTIPPDVPHAKLLTRLKGKSRENGCTHSSLHHCRTMKLSKIKWDTAPVSVYLPKFETEMHCEHAHMMKQQHADIWQHDGQYEERFFDFARKIQANKSQHKQKRQQIILQLGCTALIQHGRREVLGGLMRHFPYYTGRFQCLYSLAIMYYHR